MEPNSASIQTLNQELLKNAMRISRHSNSLPNRGLDWDYYHSFPEFSSSMKHCSLKIIEMMKKMYQHHGLSKNIGRLDIEEQVEMVSDSNDALMERINNALDEATGIKKQVETVVVEVMTKSGVALNGSWNQVANKITSGSPPTSYRLLTAKNILRPQLKFKEKISNKAGPFIPKLKEKPHSSKPLAILLEINDLGDEEYSHPYEFELEQFTAPENCMSTSPEVPHFKTVEEVPLVMVDTEEKLKSLLIALSNENEIAVDLEAHSYRTYQGITCLMQISTTTTDFIVDTLELWDCLSCLNEVFCNPNILKVFHGADRDVEWLQRDFGLYLVNLFDTYQAAKLLNFPTLSLAYLLRHYCQRVVNKEFQLADWRIRPLPQEMINYAREDTHYLLYVYRRMKQDLLSRSIGNNLLVAVWEHSRQTCLRRYTIQRVDADTHLELYRRSKKAFNNRQLSALKHLFAWRDKVARDEDESVGFVLPKHMMLHISEVLPREMQGILACCNPIPPLVRQHLLDLHHIILRARELPLTSLLNEGLADATGPKASLAPLDQDTEDPLHCVHDLTYSQDMRDDLPTLLGGNAVEENFTDGDQVHAAVKMEPMLHLFAGSNDNLGRPDGVTVKFVTPYQRYAHTKAIERAAALIQQRETQEKINNVHQHFVELVRSTPVTSAPETAAAAPSTSGTQVGLTPETDSRIEEDLAENAPKNKKMKKQPLSKQLASKRKKKRLLAAAIASASKNNKLDKNEAECNATSSPPKKMKLSTPKKLTQDSAPTPVDSATPFVPYDYSQVDFTVYNPKPDDRKKSKGKRATSRLSKGRKMMAKTGARSVTYSSAKP